MVDPDAFYHNSTRARQIWTKSGRFPEPGSLDERAVRVARHSFIIAEAAATGACPLQANGAGLARRVTPSAVGTRLHVFYVPGALPLINMTRKQRAKALIREYNSLPMRFGERASWQASVQRTDGPTGNAGARCTGMADNVQDFNTGRQYAALACGTDR